MRDKNQNLDPERPVTDFPYTQGRLKSIDYETIIKEGKPWTDPYFRPEISSILDGTMMRPDRLKAWETFTWKRPSEMYGQGKFSIYQTISPSDIKQGYCGDCYYLSSISSLAENPERVKAIFLTKEINDAGCYAMKFYLNGEPKIIVVDDYFPYCNHKAEWAFSRSSLEKEIWVLLLEKAWAKIYGSYQRIEAGTTGEALPALTGAPSTFTFHNEQDDKEVLWKMIREADMKNYIIATAIMSSKQGKTSDEMKNVGLVDAHAYSLIATHEEEMTQTKGKKLRLIKIRNPWGFKEWNGDWSDKSDKWTPELKEKLQLQDMEDGIFFISFEDYLNFFYITTICKYIDTHDLSVMPDQHTPGNYCIQRFNIPQSYDTQIVFVLNQIHARFVDETMRGSYKYAPIKFIIAKILQTGLTTANSKNPRNSIDQPEEELAFIDGEYICYQHAHIELPKLSDGEYILFFKAEWDALNPVKKLVMNIYAPDPIEIFRVHARQFPFSVFSMLDEWLGQRLQMGHKYEVPVMSELQDQFNEEDYKLINGINLKFNTGAQGEKVFYKYSVQSASQNPSDTPTLIQGIEEQSLEMMPRSIQNKNHQFTYQTQRFESIVIDVIRQPINQMFVLKPSTTKVYVSQSYSQIIRDQQSSASKAERSEFSGAYLTFRMGQAGVSQQRVNQTLTTNPTSPQGTEIQVEIKANNDRNVFCIENIDCPPLCVDLEVSCPTLTSNLQIKNVQVGRGDKKIRRLEGNITQHSNSCFKYIIRAFNTKDILTLSQNQQNIKEELKNPNDDALTVIKDEQYWLKIDQEAKNIIIENGGDFEYPQRLDSQQDDSYMGGGNADQEKQGLLSQQERMAQQQQLELEQKQ